MEYIKSFIQGGRYQDAIDIIDEYLQSYPDESHSDEYRALKAYALHKKGRYQESKALCELLIEKHGEGKLHAYVADVLGLNHWKQGDFDQAEYWIKRAIEEYHILDDRNGMGMSYNDLGLLYMMKGHIQDAEEAFLKSEEIFESDMNTVEIAYPKGNLGKIYMMLGKFTLAERYLRTAERIFLETGNDANLAYIYRNYGNLYEAEGDLKRGLESYLRALELRRHYGNSVELSESMFYLCRTLQKMGKDEECAQYVKELQDMVDKGAPTLVRIYLAYIQGLQMIDQKRVFAKFTARPKMEEVLQNVSTPFELKIQATLAVLDLLFLELEIADTSKEIIEEIETYIYFLQNYAEWSHSPMLKIELLLLESKFSVLHMRFKEAKEKLLEAEQLGNEIESPYINQMVKERIRELEENLVKWQESINKNPRTKKEVEEVDIVEYMKKIVKLEFD